MYLVDSNIWLERLLDQERSAADAVIVSFGSDLDGTDRKRRTPEEILREEDVAQS